MNDCNSHASDEPESCKQLFTFSPGPQQIPSMTHVRWKVFSYLSLHIIEHFSAKKLFANSIRVWLTRRLFYYQWWWRRISPENFVCKHKATRAQCLWRRKFCIFRFSISWRLVYFFSGRKFSSSSLLKILFGLFFRLEIAFLALTGIVFGYDKCFEFLSFPARKMTNLFEIEFWWQLEN